MKHKQITQAWSDGWMDKELDRLIDIGSHAVCTMQFTWNSFILKISLVYSRMLRMN